MRVGNTEVSQFTVQDKAGQFYPVKGSVKAWVSDPRKYTPGDGLLKFEVLSPTDNSVIGTFLFFVTAKMSAVTRRINLQEEFQRKGIATAIYSYVKNKGFVILRTKRADTDAAKGLSSKLLEQNLVVNLVGD